MGLSTFLNKNKKLIFALTVVLVGCMFLDKFQFLFSSFITVQKQKVTGVLHPEELAQFNGVQKKKLYLALLGSIFDVTKGKKHYGKGASYNYFIGKYLFLIFYSYKSHKFTLYVTYGYEEVTPPVNFNVSLFYNIYFCVW